MTARVSVLSRVGLRSCALLGAARLAAAISLPQTLTVLRSPDGRNAICAALDAAGSLTYSVSRGGRVVIADSPLGLRCRDEDFTTKLTVVSVGPRATHREVYTLFAGVTPRVDRVHCRRTVVLRSAAGATLALDLDAANEGVAFRYRLPDAGEGTRTVNGEHTGFRLGAESQAWLQPYSPATSVSPAYEDYYYRVAPGDPPPAARQGKARGWCFPALFHAQPSGVWALIAESGTEENYCGCHLNADSAGGLYRIEFAYPDEGTSGHLLPPGQPPTHTLPWIMPWRVIVLGDRARDLLTSTLITDLAPPCAFEETSWITPGRASWSWWAHPDGPQTVELYARYVEFAHRLGWEYSLLDAGWWQTDMPRVAALGREQKPGLWLWTAAGDFYDTARRQAKLDELAGLGAQGVKVDFWCSDRQETVAAIVATLREAAERRLVVNLHGCTVPRGWQRTYPNLLTAEAVLGAESYMFDERFAERAAEFNTILPFARNVAGPVDYTPLGLTMRRFERRTTAAHELALALVLTSGLIHYADDPEVYDALPEAARDVLRDAPARWEETRCLVGDPGRCVVVARRAGRSWFVAGLNGANEPLPLRLPLGAFGRYPRRTLIEEGEDALLQLRATSVPATDPWEHTLPPRGGFVLRLDQ